MRNKTIKVDYLSRVEGESALYIRIKNARVADVKLKIFEPPRFFEAFLRGRNYSEVPDITARICGICPIAYQMSSVHALEDAFGIKVDGQIRALRRLIYCGEWIESHTLHIYMLHAPDFLGYDDVLQMAKKYPKVVQQALKLKKVGNELVSLLGGREIHPINVRVGGFYRVPRKQELNDISEKLKKAQDIAVETVRWAGTLSFPDFEQEYEYVALHHPAEYPFNEGRILSNKGLDIAVREYENHFIEEHMHYSSALHSRLRARGAYLTGPLARYNLNSDKLTPRAKEEAKKAGLGAQCFNPFKSIIVRSVETLYACEEALRIIQQYEMPEKPAVDMPIHAGTGYGCTEAPRGILYHRYRVNEQGIIQDAKIIPPTSQNQKSIESDLYHFVSSNLHLPAEKLTWMCEQTIRNYDPCISCSTHFLKLHFKKE